jgi:hypothetical protein
VLLKREENMKKSLFGLLLFGLLAINAQAADKVRWPVWFTFSGSEDVDVIGLRIPVGGYCDQVTGFEMGLVGRCRYFNGFQMNVFRSAVEDEMAGWQFSFLYNSIGHGNGLGIQSALWNESQIFSGLQFGLVNLADYCNGFQIGIINRAEDLYGFQFGLVNVIRNSTMPFCPIMNVGF